MKDEHADRPRMTAFGGWLRGAGRTFRTTRRALVVAVLWLAACSEIQRVPLGECGNHVVEDGEECDGGSRCSDACHVTCDAETSCPAGFRKPTRLAWVAWRGAPDAGPPTHVGVADLIPADAGRSTGDARDPH